MNFCPRPSAKWALTILQMYTARVQRSKKKVLSANSDVILSSLYKDDRVSGQGRTAILI